MPQWLRQLTHGFSLPGERPKAWAMAVSGARLVALLGVAFNFWVLSYAYVAWGVLALGLLYALGAHFLHSAPIRTRRSFFWWLPSFIDTVLMMVFIWATGGGHSPLQWVAMMPPVFGSFLYGPGYGLLQGFVLTIFEVIINVGGSSQDLLHEVVYIGLMWSLYGVVNYLQSAERQARSEATRQSARNRDLEALADAKLQFISIASHELRTPLTVIKGYNRIMQSMLDDPLALRDHNHEITRAVDRMELLIEELLDFGRLQSEQLKLTFSSVSLDRMAADVTRAIRVLADQRGQHLELDLPPEPISVWADARRLEQVFINLLNNALKYSPPDSVVRLKMRALADKIRIEVTDQGPGIATEHQPHLFTPFYRAQAEESSVPGVGLGLAICQGIMTAHGGQIGVQSTLGAGATFWFELPRSRVEKLVQPFAETRA